MITVVASLKGGSGKSTVTFNLAIWLSNAEQKTVLFDLDPQLTLTDAVELRREENYKPLLSVQSIAEFDKFKTDTANQKKSRKSQQVLMDVGTADLERMQQALLLADRIIVPVPPSQADIWSTQRFLQMLDKLYREHKKTRCEIITFLNRADTHHAVRESDETAAALLTLPNTKFVKSRLYQRTLYRRSFSEGLAVFEMHARSKAAREFMALVANLYPDIIKD